MSGQLIDITAGAGPDSFLVDVPVQVAVLWSRMVNARLSPPAMAVPLAAVPGSDTDVFAQLEAEMVSDKLAAAQQERRTEADRVARTLTAAFVGGAGPLEVSRERLQMLMEWLNRSYVCLRTADLSRAGVPVRPGQGQSAVFTEDDDALADEMPMVTAAFAVCVNDVHQALLST